ncbi:hypothetical protein [Actinokineospora fastidiosa]|uniref:Lipoprotein n=1 Tax=Actinokineospora fastidiosa TaxID=1816 RepID=A0A918GIB2_9PSEU|nr:hypothetical protein [Actinokineospora fastidiosa]GGS40361.1 hypothetical protein GCM10010171_38520 [Actinokineospora fastidiosa]
MRMRGRRRGGAVVALGAVLTLGAACTSAVGGVPQAAGVMPATAGQTAAQSLLDLAESGAVHYVGTMTASNEKVDFDLVAARTGEIQGKVVIGGQPASVLVVNDTIYLKGAAAFWNEISGIGGTGRSAAIAGRWVQTPSGLLGLEFSGVFAPEALSNQLARGAEAAGDEPFTEAGTESVAGVDAVKVTTEGGTLYLAEEAPHGLLKVEAPRLGRADPTSVEDLTAEIKDASAELTAFYAEFAKNADALAAPVDALTTVTEGEHNFDGCGADSCSIVVRFTNSSKLAVTVSVRGTWQGDGAPLGTCDTKAGPVAPGQQGEARCTLNTPQWKQFYQRANSVAGNHPYSVEWSTLVLADAPDLTQLQERAAVEPATASDRTEGSHFVYALAYGDGQVWKYGVAAGDSWQEHAGRQLSACLAATKALCDVDLVTATDSAVAGYRLMGDLVAEECPAGQWAACKR